MINVCFGCEKIAIASRVYERVMPFRRERYDIHNTLEGGCGGLRSKWNDC